MTTTLNPPDVRLSHEQRLVLETLATTPEGASVLGKRTVSGATVSGQAARNIAEHGLALILEGTHLGDLAIITPLGHAYLELICRHCGNRPDSMSKADKAAHPMAVAREVAAHDTELTQPTFEDAFALTSGALAGLSAANELLAGLSIRR